MSLWTDHLQGLAEIEDNIGKKVAFLTCAEKITQQAERIDALEKIRDAAQEVVSWVMCSKGDPVYNLKVALLRSKFDE